MDSQSQMDFLEVPLGLSANLFADDLDIDGSILDISLDEGLKKSNAANQSLEDLLLTDSTEDPLGEEWMETLDLEPFLDSTDFTTTEDITPSKKVGADVLDISSLLNTAIAGEVKIEPRKEGMKASAFELLKALLTEQQPIKADLSLDILQPAEVQSSKKLPILKSPEAEVPMFDFSGCGSSENKDTQNVIFHTFEDLIQPEISLGNGDVVEISLTSELGNVITQTDADEVSYICSPLSTEAESVLSSGPSSPFGYTEDFSTIDSNFLSSDEACSSSAKSSQVSDESFTKLKSKSKSKRSKAKASPYDSDYSVGTVTDKRQRKKMQNKNAATRYRVKKRNEKETLQEQEVRLSDKNHELKEKVESLQREIQYMKELMHEINKAKKSKI